MQGQRENGEGKEKVPQGRDLTSPSVGLMAPGKLSHGRVQEGQGWGAKTASMPFSLGRDTQNNNNNDTHTHYTHTHVTIETPLQPWGSVVQMVVMKWFKEKCSTASPLLPLLAPICSHSVSLGKSLLVHLLQSWVYKWVTDTVRSLIQHTKTHENRKLRCTR